MSQLIPTKQTRLLQTLAKIDQEFAEVNRLQSGPTDAEMRRRLKRVRAALRQSRIEAGQMVERTPAK